MLRDPSVCLSIIENAAEAILAVDKECRVTYQNPEARRLFGFHDDEIFGRIMRDAIPYRHPDGSDVPPDQCHVYRAAVYSETSRDFIWRVTRDDGSPLFLSCTSSPLLKDGKQIGAVFCANDITDRKIAEDALANVADKLQLATDVAEIGFYDFYPQENRLVWSSAIKKHFGLPPGAPVTRETFFSGIHPDDRDRVAEANRIAFLPESNGKYHCEYRTVGLVDGKVRWLISNGQIFFENGMPVRLIGATVDITELKQAEDKLRRAAQHDTLTGLPNRALLAEYGAHILAMAERDSAGCALLFIDLDRFKPINDLYGHEVGDKVLQDVAERLRKVTRKEDILSRLGGDEFVVLLPHVDGPHDAQAVASHIIDSINKPITVGPIEASVSPSVGISIYPKHGKTVEDLIRTADAAMYEAKRAGKNTFRMYIPGLEEHTTEALQLEIHLKHALEEGSLALFYQPIVDIHTEHIVGVEALLRMRGLNGEWLMPDQFIPIAEAAGLIDRIGQWVADAACKQHQAWRNAGLPAVSVAINVSSLEFRQSSFAKYLAQAIDRYDMDPRCLQIELTESAVMDNLADAVITLKEIRSMGVRVALDDFGTGYSSLSYLSTLPLDKLKIDQSFIKKLDSNAMSQAITDTIIGLGRVMNLEVVGEGIESEPAMRYLRDRGCDQAQGFLFSKPLPAHEFESWYRGHPNRLH